MDSIIIDTVDSITVDTLDSITKDTTDRITVETVNNITVDKTFLANTISVDSITRHSGQCYSRHY